MGGESYIQESGLVSYAHGYDDYADVDVRGQFLMVFDPEPKGSCRALGPGPAANPHNPQ